MGCTKDSIIAGCVVRIKDKERLMRDCGISRLVNMKFCCVREMEKYLGTEQRVDFVGDDRVRIKGYTWPWEAIEYKGILSTGERIL